MNLKIRDLNILFNLVKSLRVIQHKDIDRALFNQCVNRYSKNDLYAQDFVWDALHPKWDLLIFGDYKALVPLPTKRKMGLVSYRQPIFYSHYSWNRGHRRGRIE